MTAAPTLHAVPTAPSGLEGWTTCCAAAVTFSDVALCCKGCWAEVATVPLTGEAGAILDSAVAAVLTGALTPEQGIAAQRHALQMVAVAS